MSEFTQPSVLGSAVKAPNPQPDPDDPRVQNWQATLEELLPFIKDEALHLCRRKRLTKEDSEDFLSTLLIKLIEDDYRILREWSGRGSMHTYLRTVIARELADYLRHLWGRYRESAEAKKLGPLAMRLEQLLTRDDLTLEEAIRTLLINDHVEASEAGLRELADKLPRRDRRSFESDAKLPLLPSPDLDPEQRKLGQVSDDERRKTLESLYRALDRLDRRERVVIRLTGLRQCRVPRLAPRLDMDAPSVYRMRNRALAKLRKDMEADGISAELIRRLLGDEAGLGDGDE